jgi:hypothetical protein
MRTILMIFFASFAIVSISQSDTISVWLESARYPSKSLPLNPNPYQTIFTGKGVPAKVDSIRVCNQPIGFGMAQYYLVVSIDSIKILEGDFYGTLSNGKIKKYDRWGRISFEGENQFKLPNRKNTLPYSYKDGTKRKYRKEWQKMKNYP